MQNPVFERKEGLSLLSYLIITPSLLPHAVYQPPKAAEIACDKSIC